eukprot:1137107-Amphidinium_carterae.1
MRGTHNLASQGDAPASWASICGAKLLDVRLKDILPPGLLDGLPVDNHSRRDRRARCLSSRSHRPRKSNQVIRQLPRQAFQLGEIGTAPSINSGLTSGTFTSKDTAVRHHQDRPRSDV